MRVQAKVVVRALSGAALLTLGACAVGTREAAPEEGPIELGRVAWERHFDAACSRAGREGRDLLMLFQEVPG